MTDLSSRAVLELANVTRSFGGTRVLHPTNFSIDYGDYVAITGASGSGKSTLLNLMGLLDVPSAGSIAIDGVETGRLGESLRSSIRSQHIGFVFQAFHLISSRTAVENVELGMLYQQVPRREVRARALAALGTVGLSHRLDSSPRTLSGGERQRVAIARALAGKPSILLADEPTGNLDSTTTKSILDLFETLNDNGITIVVVTHEQDVANRARRRFTMSDGRMIETLVQQ